MGKINELTGKLFIKMVHSILCLQTLTEWTVEDAAQLERLTGVQGHGSPRNSEENKSFEGARLAGRYGLGSYR